MLGSEQKRPKPEERSTPERAKKIDTLLEKPKMHVQFLTMDAVESCLSANSNCKLTYELALE